MSEGRGPGNAGRRSRGGITGGVADKELPDWCVLVDDILMVLFSGRERKFEYTGDERGESPVSESSRRLANCGGATGVVVGVGVGRAEYIATALVGVIIDGLIGVIIVPVVPLVREPEPLGLLGNDTVRFSGDI